MRIPKRPRGRGVVFNITPLIDVVFNLVIFFLVASHFARTEPNETVSLPSATQTTEDEQPRRLSITIQPDGTYSVGGRRVGVDALDRMIEEGAGDAPLDFAVRIRGDEKATYQFVEPIMLACARHGIQDFGFKVVSSEQ